MLVLTFPIVFVKLLANHLSSDLRRPGSRDVHRCLPLPHEQHRRQLAGHRRPHLQVDRVQGGALPRLARIDRRQWTPLLRRVTPHSDGVAQAAVGVGVAVTKIVALDQHSYHDAATAWDQ